MKRCLYLSLLLSLLASAAFGQSESIVVNGDFEQLDDAGKAVGWEISDVEQMPDGNHVNLVPFSWGHRQIIDVEPNTRYLIRMDIKHHHGPSPARLVFNVTDADENKLTSSSNVMDFDGDDWQTMYVMVNTPSNAAAASLYTLTLLKDGKSAFYCDNVSVAAMGRAPASTSRVFEVADPLYESLLSDQPPGLVAEGPMVWRHMVFADQLRDVAKRMGLRYSEEETHAHLAAHNMHPIYQSMPEHDAALLSKHGVTVALYPREKPADAVSLLHPDSIAYYFERARDVLANHPDMVWAVFAQDEATEHAIREILKLRDESPDDPFFQQTDQAVRERFGFGRYGIPTAADDDDEPFRWIAFRRWINATFRERHEKLKAMVDEFAPHARMISTDPMDQLAPYEFSRQSHLFDIFTQQYLPLSDPSRHALGLYTKIMADITGKEMWPCVHVENYAYPTTPDEVHAMYSQMFRNGGSGFHLYIPDTRNAALKTNDTRLTAWGSPRRYRAILEIMAIAAKQNKLRFPADEGCRILFTQISYMPGRSARSFQAPLEACYNLLGPATRSWFTFIDEYRLEHPLGDTPPRVIYLPFAGVVDSDTRDRLGAFVRNGGTLIVGDPNAFSHDPDGSATAAYRQQLVGAKRGDKLIGVQNIIVDPHTLFAGMDQPLSVPVLATAYELELDDDTQTLARFDDGSSAVTLRTLGEGRVIYFACQPFNMATRLSSQYQQLFAALQQGLRMSVGLDIWRFTLPPLQTVEQPAPQGVCLTNNHVEWREEQQFTGYNHDAGATYTLDPQPNVHADHSDDLIDRRGWPELEKDKEAGYRPYVEPLDWWVDTWQGDEPVTVTFTFDRAYTPLRAHLYFSGRLPAAVVETSGDGRAWSPVGEMDTIDAGADVLDMVIATQGAMPARYVRLRFDAPGDAAFTLAEVEIWGTNP
jgi:hypothetical protein